MTPEIKRAVRAVIIKKYGGRGAFPSKNPVLNWWWRKHATPINKDNLK